MELPEEVIVFTTETDARDRETPVLAEGLGKFTAGVEAVPVLTHRPLDCHRPPWIDRVGGSTDDRAGQASLGRDPDELTPAAASGGYDLTPIRPLLDMLASRAK